MLLILFKFNSASFLGICPKLWIMKLHFIPSDFYIKTNVGKIPDFFFCMALNITFLFPSRMRWLFTKQCIMLKMAYYKWSEKSLLFFLNKQYCIITGPNLCYSDSSLDLGGKKQTGSILNVPLHCLLILGKCISKAKGLAFLCSFLQSHPFLKAMSTKLLSPQFCTGRVKLLWLMLWVWNPGWSWMASYH